MELIGIVATIFGVIAAFIFFLDSIKKRKLSLTVYMILFIAFFYWSLYGYYINNYAILITGGVTTLFIILTIIFYFAKKK